MVHSHVARTLRTARKESQSLIPIIGAGLSIPLGLPSWQDFRRTLAEAAQIPVDENEKARNFMSRAQQKMPRSQYLTIVRQILNVPSNRTSVALQALASGRIKMIATTNLDFAIENAFLMRGSPLPPQNVITGELLRNPRNILDTTTGCTIAKIHGSLEDPSSWVLDKDQYDKAYYPDGGLLRQWWTNLPGRPLFVGFGLSDDDVSEMLRWMEVANSVGAYAILLEEDLDSKKSNLLDNGINPIPIANYDQIPEAIDEIFQCEPLRVEIYQSIGAESKKLIIGATKADIPIGIGQNDQDELVKLIANSVDYMPARSLVDDGAPRRKYGTKGAAKNSIVDAIDQRRLKICVPIIEALQVYPELFLSHILIPSMKSSKKTNYALELIWSKCDEKTRETVQNFVADVFKDPSMFSYGALRGISWFAAHILHSHPAMCLPPQLVQATENLQVCKYPITRFQAGALLKGECLENSHPIRPFTLRSIADANAIVNALNLEFSDFGRWRLPSRIEWEMIASCPPDRWPWGAAEPEPFKHAHLKYNRGGGAAATHPMDVGVFPLGLSKGGVSDLIGNVYEVVTDENAENGYSLCGGSWTTSYIDCVRSKFSIVSLWGKGENNVGVRPVLSKD